MNWLSRLRQSLSFALPPVLRNRVAVVTKDPYRRVWGNGLLPVQDPTLASRGYGKGIWLYDEIEQDAHAYAVLQKRKMAVIRVPWSVEPASDSRLDKKAAALVKEQLESIEGDVDALPGFDGLCLHLLDAILKGYALAELGWEVNDGLTRLKQVWGVDARRVTFLGSDQGYEMRLLTTADMLRGEPIPDKKFVLHSFGSKTGDPRGMGLGSRLWWPVYFKRQDITFWLSFADRFGSPLPVGKYPPGATEVEKQTLYAALQAFGQESGMMIPEGMMVELLQAGSTSTDIYEKLARWCDEQISECVLGETGTTNQSGSGGSRARDEVANTIRLEIVQADSDLLSATLNRTLVRWISEFNVPEANPPRVWRDTSQPEDLNVRINRDKVLFDLGYKLRPEMALEIYGNQYQDMQALAKDEAPPPLAKTLGVGSMQALISFLQQLRQSGIPKGNAVAILGAVFGIPEGVAAGMVPDAQAAASPSLEEVEQLFSQPPPDPPASGTPLDKGGRGGSTPDLLDFRRQVELMYWQLFLEGEGDDTDVVG